jgi:LmbE family N-acetylglucosaminyl deacetylase
VPEFTATLRVLMVFAHADDETLLAGALIAKLVADGKEVRVLCLAPGGDDRTGRLRKACDDLGVTAVETLRYSEGAMWPDENKDSTSNNVSDKLSPNLAIVPTVDLAGRIAGRITEHSPDIVITHSSYGDYGHADHAAVHRATVSAFETSAHGGARLYSLDWSRRLVRFNAKLMKIGGRDIRRMGPNGRFNLSLALEISDKTTITLKVGNYLAARRRASCWYEPEIAKGPLPMRILERLPLLIQRLFLGKTRLTLLNSSEQAEPRTEL